MTEGAPMYATANAERVTTSSTAKQEEEPLLPPYHNYAIQIGDYMVQVEIASVRNKENSQERP